MIRAEPLTLLAYRDIPRLARRLLFVSVTHSTRTTEEVMKSLFQHRGLAATLMLGVMAATLIAPAAEAGHGRGNSRRWKSGPPSGYDVRYSAPAYPAPRAYYGRQHSDAVPLFAGLVGGLVLGAALSHSQSAVHANYSYWDPYCEESYSSLESYQSHVRGCHHPRVARVIEISSGDCVRVSAWRDNAWRVCGGDGRYGDSYGGRDDGRYDNRGGDDDWDN